MQRCLIIINKNAGKCRKCTPEKVQKVLGTSFEYDTVYLPSDKSTDYSGYRAVAVCGGDGTLSSIIQELCSVPKTVYYFPCGTLNDRAKAKRYQAEEAPKPMAIGRIGDRIFTYVFAAGAFTPIGYIADVKSKKRFGVLAYVLKILEAYKVNRIKAKITLYEAANDADYDGKAEGNGDWNCDAIPRKTDVISGEFNLLMFIKSPRCFGFGFNRAYDENSTSGHLVAIRSPKHGGLLGKIEMFFPFFRVFFIGLKEEMHGTIEFRSVSKARISLPSLTSFCADGEQAFLSGEHDLSFEKTTCRLVIENGRF